jgi:hypothetical protein
MFEQQRLQVRLLSVYAMSAALVLLIICGLAILTWGPRSVVSRNPNSIATHAAILASSTALNNALSDGRHLVGEALRKHMQGRRIQSGQTSTLSARAFAVNIDRIAERREPATKDSQQRLTWWRPVALHVPFIMWAVLLPVSVNVVLEVLQRLSDTRNGITDVSLVSAPGREAASLLTSFVLTVTAMSYGAINFAVATLAPYRSLRRGSATSARSLLQNEVGQLTISAMIRPLRNRHPSIALALAAATGSWLTIVASGLYTIEAVPLVSRIDLVGTDRFVNKGNGSTDNAAASVFHLLEHRNASYPDFTFDGVALPVLQVPAARTVGQASGSLVQVPLTARRGSLNCTVVPQANTTISTVYGGTDGSGDDVWATSVDWRASVPDSCPVFQNQSDITVTSISFSEMAVHGNGSNPALADLLGGGIVQPGPWGDLGAPTNGPGCPSLAFSFGRYRLNSTSPENLTAIACVQGVEEVRVDTTFQLPDMTISTDQPPLVDESSARWIASEDST